MAVDRVPQILARLVEVQFLGALRGLEDGHILTGDDGGLMGIVEALVPLGKGLLELPNLLLIDVRRKNQWAGRIVVIK